MKERDCANCKHHTSDGCSSWDCEFEAKDLISRADAIRWVKTECNPYGKPTLDYDSGLKVIEHLKEMPSELPSADAEPKRVLQGYCKGANTIKTIRHEELTQIANTRKAVESADAVPQLKQTDTLIIADALRYLAKDTERHLVDRTRADALRQQFLKYGASMCKGR